MEKKKKSLKMVICCFVAVMAIFTFVGSTTASPGESDAVSVEENMSVLVKTEKPVIGDISLTNEYIGKIEPGQQLIIFPKVSGEVLAANFQVGDAVEEGDVLCELDSTAFQSTIKQTQAAIWSAQAKAKQNLAIAENNLATFDSNVTEGHDNTLKAASNSIDSAVQGKSNAELAVETAENRRSAANASLITARRQLHEFRDNGTLPATMASMIQLEGMLDDQIEDQLRDAVSQAQIAADAAELGVEQAKLALEIAKQNLIKAQDSLTTAEVAVESQRTTMSGQVELARLNTNFNDQYIALQKLQDDLDHFKVTAPISGIIEQRNVEPHTMASPQSPLYTISNKDVMLVVFNVSSNAAQNLKIGDMATVKIGSGTYTGTVSEIGTTVNSVGLFPVKVKINGDPSLLMTGLAVTVSADTQHTEGAITLPLKYVYFRNNEAYVYAVEDDKAVIKPIQIGLMTDETVEILSGISAETQVISTWSPDLKDGVSVEVTRGE